MNEFEKAEIEDVQGKVDDWKESIDDILYDLLEKEVLSRHEIKQRMTVKFWKCLQSARSENHDLNDEIMRIQTNLSSSRFRYGYHRKSRKRLEQLFKDLILLKFKINDNKVIFSFTVKNCCD